MGLDQFAFKIKAKLTKEVDFSSEIHSTETGEDLVEREELHYWRKHPNLEQWMSDLTLRKGVKGLTVWAVNLLTVINCNLQKEIC